MHSAKHSRLHALMPKADLNPNHFLELGCLRPNWPAPAAVRAAMTTRQGGFSQAPFDSFNLGDHVRDDPACVHRNRQSLATQLTARPVFLSQVHGAHTVSLCPDTPQGTVADACVTQHQRLVCTVMVADCLPVLLCDSTGCTVGAAHVGWRGLAGTGEAAPHGVLPEFMRCFRAMSLASQQHSATEVEIFAWLGPCIGPTAFEVGPEVRAAFLASSQRFAATAGCFERMAGHADRYWCDLAALARLQLHELGIRQTWGNDGSLKWCTVSQPSVWFSHRRDAGRLGSTGRMAACVWLA
jgi:polyphenol oxidase